MVRSKRAGLGLSYVPEPEVERDLNAGKLRQTLQQFCLEVPGLFLYYPRAAQRSPKLSAFVDCAKAILPAGGRAKTRVGATATRKR